MSWVLSEMSSKQSSYCLIHSKWSSICIGWDHHHHHFYHFNLALVIKVYTLAWVSRRQILDQDWVLVLSLGYKKLKPRQWKPYRAPSDELRGCVVGIVHGKEEEEGRDGYFLLHTFSFPWIKVCSVGISTSHFWTVSPSSLGGHLRCEMPHPGQWDSIQV